MARILFVLTITPWHDRRPFHRQGPALVADGHEVVYMSGRPDPDADHPFEIVPLSARQRRWGRLTGGLNLLPRVLRTRPDVVQLFSLELLPLGIALKLLRRCRVVYDCREDMASAMLEHRDRFPAWLRRLFHRATRAVEGLAARMFDGIVTADPAVAEMHGAMPDERKIVFYNTALLRHFTGEYAPLEERAYDVAVLGSMTPRSGIVSVVDALTRLARRGRKVRTLLIGEPDPWVRPDLDLQITEAGLADHVDVTGLVPHTDVPDLLSSARIGLVPLLDKAKFRRNIACKAFEYMACGMPTICTDLPPQRIFVHEGIGIFYPPGDAEALADAIEELLEDPGRAKSMGATARLEVEQKWNAEREQERLVEFYRHLLQMPPRERDRSPAS
jgi:glycosyltransferase involved in cell wall biosynthesis